MYKLKEKPEDFVVEEITNVKPEKNGRFVYFWLIKENLNTLQAIEYLAKALHTNPKFINYAGTKDKVAITTQLISIKGKTKEQVGRLKFKEFELKFFGYRNESLFLGELTGNKFKIKISNLYKDDLKKLDNVPKNFVNYFGEQRLSEYNAPTGKALIKGDFKVVIDLIKKANAFHYRKIREHLDKKPNDYVNALKLMPKKLLKMYVHAYQSHMWNETVRLFLKEGWPKENVEIPLIGFGLDVKNVKLKQIINQIMKIEEISSRDFLIRSLPYLSAEGDNRSLYMDIKDFKVIDKKEKSAVVSFSLGKGSYATEVIRQLFV